MVVMVFLFGIITYFDFQINILFKDLKCIFVMIKFIIIMKILSKFLPFGYQIT